MVGGQMQNQQDARGVKARKENLVALGNSKGCFGFTAAK